MKKLTLAVFLVFPMLGFAQDEVHEYNTIGWYDLAVTRRFTQKFSGHIEYQWKRAAMIRDWQQSLLQLGANYQPDEKIRLHIGFLWGLSYPYGGPSTSDFSKSTPEYSLYETITFKRPIGRVRLYNRLRLEQRWMGEYQTLSSAKPDKFVYGNRLRYQPKIEVPLDKADHLYSAIYDEMFFEYGKDVSENHFNQNRVVVMLGYNLGKAFRVEGGYINQYGKMGTNGLGQKVYLHNNGIIFNTYFNID